MELILLNTSIEAIALIKIAIIVIVTIITHIYTEINGKSIERSLDPGS